MHVQVLDGSTSFLKLRWTSSISEQRDELAVLKFDVIQRNQPEDASALLIDDARKLSADELNARRHELAWSLEIKASRKGGAAWEKILSAVKSSGFQI